MFEQLPPHDIAAEESVIASLLARADVAAKVMPRVSARDGRGEATS